MCSAVCFTSKSELPGAQGFIAGQVKHRELCFGDRGRGGGWSSQNPGDPNRPCRISRRLTFQSLPL